MQLREAEAIRVFDDHQVGIGNVHADLNHCGRDQHIQITLLKAAHDSVFFLCLKPAVQQSDLQVWQDLPS